MGEWPGVLSHLVVLETKVSHRVAGHSPFDPLCIVASCFRVPMKFQEDRQVWGQDGANSLWGSVEDVEFGAAYLKKTLLLTG